MCRFLCGSWRPRGHSTPGDFAEPQRARCMYQYVQLLSEILAGGDLAGNGLRRFHPEVAAPRATAALQIIVLYLEIGAPPLGIQLQHGLKQAEGTARLETGSTGRRI